MSYLGKMQDQHNQLVRDTSIKWGQRIVDNPFLSFEFAFVAGGIDPKQTGNARIVINSIEAEMLSCKSLPEGPSEGLNRAFSGAINIAKTAGREIEEFQASNGKIVVVRATAPAFAK